MTMRSGADEASDPKYAHFERERRWTVDRERRPDLAGQKHVLIEDRYIIGTRMRLRRMTDSLTGLQALKLTKKYESPDPLARPIVTAYLTQDEHHILSALPSWALEKRRYYVVDAGRQFSLDIFIGSLESLVLAEIEWPDDQGLRELLPPPWAKDEVSNDPRYQGGSLVQHGIPKD
jgi:CYTH domain-containing protein